MFSNKTNSNNNSSGIESAILAQNLQAVRPILNENSAKNRGAKTHVNAYRQQFSSENLANIDILDF